MRKKLQLQLFGSASVMCILTVFSAQAANFTITDAQTTTQTIGAGANEVGIIQAGGSVTRANANAVESTSVGGTLTNNGSVSTTGNNAYGVFINAANNTAGNNGTITTGGDSSSGIRSNAANSSVTNSGSITTSGSSSIALFAAAAGNILTNNGTITTTGNTADGMSGSNGATSSSYINNGTITTSGNGATGIYSSGASSNFTNNGIITTSNANAHGIRVDTGGANSTLTNNGRIVVNNSASAMRSQADDVTIINAGYAGSIGGTAIALLGARNSLILKANSTIDGGVLYADPGTATLTYDFSNAGRAGGVIQITGTITGSPTSSIINVASRARMVQSGNTVAVGTPDQFGGSQAVISQTVSDAGNVVNNRQQLALLGDTTEANGGTQYAASGASLNDAENPNGWAIRDRIVAWLEGFGSYQERGQTSDTSDSTARSGGVLAGVDLPQTSDGIRAGFFAGGFGGALDVGTFRDVSSTGGMVGGYVGKSYGEYYVSGGLNLGFSNNDADRYTGVDTATSDYTSYFVSPSLTVMRPIKKDGFTLVPNATLRYTAQHDGSYSEKGSLTNQSVNSRTSHSLDARAIIEARLDGKRVENSLVVTAFRAGIQGQAQLGNNNADVTVLGNNLSFDPNGNDNTVDGVLGFNVSQSLDGGPQLYLDAEANLGLNHGGPADNKGIVGRLGAKWKL